MANLATTTYKVTGTREAVSNLWTTFQDMEVDSKDIRLFKMCIRDRLKMLCKFLGTCFIISV